MAFDIIIPARYASTRLPGKPLVDLLGKTVVERVYIAAKASDAERVVIATDDERIKKEVQRFGGEVCMTSPEHLSGTDRLAEVVNKMQFDSDRVIVNVQGDEPFIDNGLINQVAQVLIHDQQLNMSTACHVLADPEAIANPNIVKVVMNEADEALYFSRSPIPYQRDSQLTSHVYFQHLGIYGYRASFINTFSSMPPSSLELSESLEQLRVLQAGHRIKLIRYTGPNNVGIDTPEDVKLAIARLQAIVGEESES